MTGRTHDLAAFTALTFIVATIPLQKISLATGLVAIAANMLGGIAPDIDQPTADLWHRIPVGGIVGRIVDPFLGGHRFISHSIIGIGLFGFAWYYFLQLIKGILLVDMNVVWWAFMIGFVSHLVMDTFTREGVPWLLPIPYRFGIPPIKLLRIQTGGFIEKGIIFPGLLLLTGYIVYMHYGKFLDLIKHYLK